MSAEGTIVVFSFWTAFFTVISVEDLIRMGQDLEKVVLSDAVRWHLERKILTYNNKTVVFD